MQIFNILKKYGVSIDDTIYYETFLKQEKIATDIKKFVEEKILNHNYYNEVPIIKKDKEQYYFLKYQLLEDKKIKIKFYLIADDNKFECGILYDLSNTFKLKIEDKYITIYDNGEELIINEF